MAALDLPEENISTLLCYLENNNDEKGRQWLKLHNPVYSLCKIRDVFRFLMIKLSFKKDVHLLCPSIFWGPRLIARSPRRRQREKNLEPQKIDGLSTSTFHL